VFARPGACLPQTSPSTQTAVLNNRSWLISIFGQDLARKD